MAKRTKTKLIRLRGFVYTSRLILGSIFVYASIDKIIYPSEFARIVQNYGILPDSLSNLVAIVLPLLELILGAFLIVGILIGESALILSSFLAIFMIAIGTKSLNGTIEDCGCFSHKSFLSSDNLAFIFLRDFILLGFGIFIVVTNRHNQKVNAND